MLLLELLNFFIRHLDLRLIVHFVSEDHYLDITARVFLNLTEPDRYAEEALAVGQVKDYNDSISALVVRVRDGSVSLLAGRVPNLQLDRALVDLQCAETEVYPDRANVVLLEAVIGKSDEQTGFADVSVPNQHHLEQVVILLLHAPLFFLKYQMPLCIWTCSCLQAVNANA